MSGNEILKKSNGIDNEITGNGSNQSQSSSTKTGSLDERKPDLTDLYQNIFDDKEKNEEFQMTHREMEQIKDALKKEEFCKLLTDYVQDIRDPANQLLYQSELRELEKQRGNTVHFINPVAGYVLKTSINGQKKCFINMCTNALIQKPSFQISTQQNKIGQIWSIPHSPSAGREDIDKAGTTCTVFDVIFNPEALRLAKQNNSLKQKLEETAIEAIETSFNVKLDKNNVRRPKLKYKGLKNATMIKYKSGDSPPPIIDPNELSKETPPQKDNDHPSPKKAPARKDSIEKAKKSLPKEKAELKEANSVKNVVAKSEVEKAFELEKPAISKQQQEWTEPHYSLKFRNHINIQDFCLDTQRDGRNVKPIPEEIILTVDLPLLKDSTDLQADVLEDGWHFELKTDKKILYKLNMKLPFQVHYLSPKATFDKDKRKLVIVMKTIQKEIPKDSFPPSAPKPIITSISDENDDHDFDFLERDGDGKVKLLSKEIEEADKHDSVFESARCRKPSSLDSVGSYNLSRSSSCIDYDTEDSSSAPNNFGSPNTKKTVRFSDEVKRQIYRSNSSILGQRKKNQRKAKNKKKARERLNSGESVSSLSIDDSEDGDYDRFPGGGAKARERFNSGGSISSVDEEFLVSGSSSKENHGENDPLDEEEITG